MPGFGRERPLFGVVPRGHTLLYATGMMSMFLGSMLLIFCIYILPYLLFDLQYPVPDSIIDLRFWLEREGEMDFLLLLAVITPPIMVGAALLYMAKLSTQKMEGYVVTLQRDHEGEEAAEGESTNHLPEPRKAESVVIKIIFVILGLITVLVITEYFIFGRF